VGHPLPIELEAVGEALGLDGDRARPGTARGGPPGDGHAGLEESEGVGAQGRMGLDQLGQRDPALERVTDE
jgi:hypothetical protein